MDSVHNKNMSDEVKTPDGIKVQRRAIRTAEGILN